VEDHIIYNPTKYTCPHFTGREEYIRQLARFFKSRNIDDVPFRREFLLYGIGGAGKTQICLKFAEKHSKLYVLACDRDLDKCYILTFGFLSRFWKVFWVDATNQETLELSFQEIGLDEVAKRDGVDGSTESVKHWLSRARKEWLLILDNADGDSAILDDYIPNGGRGNILISSRNPSLLHRIKRDAAMEVGALERDNAKLLLGKIMHLDDMTMKDEDLRLGSIVDELYCIALAIDHAGAAMLLGLCHLSDYTEKLQKHRRHLLANSKLRGAPGYNNTLYSTWSLTTTLLEERARLGSPDTSPEGIAIQLLNLFAFFHNNSIMEETFRRAVEVQNSSTAVDVSGDRRLPIASEFLPRNLLQTDADGKWDSLVFRKGIQTLWSFSLLQRDKRETTYSIHPLVHLWSRERLNQREQNKTCLAMYAILSSSIGYDASGHDLQYSASIGYTSSSHDFQYCRRVIPHLRALRQAMTDSKITENYFDDAFSSFWHVFAENGLMKEAEHFASELMRHRTQELGERDERTLLAAEYLTDTLLKSGTEGTLGRSILLLEETYRLRIETLGENHPATIRSKILLGITHHIDGSYGKAEELLSAAWHSAVFHLGETHPSTLRAAEYLSSVYSKIGNCVQAEEIQQKILETMIINFGDEDLRTIDAMANLAVTVTNMGRFDESETLKRRIAELRTQKMGMYHPDTIMAYSNLAATYGRQKRWKEAEEIILDVIERRIEVLGELHRETLRARLTLTMCLEAQGRLLEAEAQCKIVLEGRKVVIGETHADTLWSMHQLASIYAGQNRLGEAIDLWERAVAMQRESESLGEGYWETQETMHCLACALYRYGQKEKAILLMERVLELKRKRLPNAKEDPTILASQKALLDWKTESNQAEPP
jgi:tetratricopeptide (TPR) repeat protein